MPRDPRRPDRPVDRISRVLVHWRAAFQYAYKRIEGDTGDGIPGKVEPSVIECKLDRDWRREGWGVHQIPFPTVPSTHGETIDGIG